MVKLPKSIIKKYGITKKAWAVFRKSKGGGRKKKRTRNRVTPKKRRASARRKTAGSHSGITGGEKMAKRRRKSRRTARHTVRRSIRRARVAMGGTTGKIIMTSGEVAGGAVLSSLLVNKGPVIKDQSKMVKSGAQAVLGILAIRFFRNPHLKTMGAGAVVSAVMGLAKDILKVEPLAGPGGSRALSPADMAVLSRGLGIPLEQMGIPLQNGMNGAVQMTAPTGFKGGF